MEQTKCPVCGSEKRFFEGLAEEAVEKHLAPEGFRMGLIAQQGIAADQKYLALIPTGGKVPAFTILLDICDGCGVVYAVQRDKGEAQKQATPVHLARPAGVDLTSLVSNLGQSRGRN